MIDFGLGSLFQEVEKHLGSKAAKICALFAVGAFVAICIGAMWTYFFWPVLFAIYNFYLGQASLLNSVWEIVTRVTMFGLVVFVTLNIMNAFSIKRAREEAEATLDETLERLDLVIKVCEAFDQHLGTTVENADLTQEMINKIVALLKSLSDLTTKVTEFGEKSDSEFLKTEAAKLGKFFDGELKDIERLIEQAEEAVKAARKGTEGTASAVLAVSAATKKAMLLQRQSVATRTIESDAERIAE